MRLKRFSPGHRRAWREHKLVHDLLTRHAQTETWGVYSQVHVMSSDNTSTPWKLCSFSIFPILILRKICSYFAEYFFCPIGSSTVTNKNSTFKTEGRNTEVNCKSWPFFVSQFFSNEHLGRFLIYFLNVLQLFLR